MLEHSEEVCESEDGKENGKDGRRGQRGDIFPEVVVPMGLDAFDGCVAHLECYDATTRQSPWYRWRFVFCFVSVLKSQSALRRQRLRGRRILARLDGRDKKTRMRNGK